MKKTKAQLKKEGGKVAALLMQTLEVNNVDYGVGMDAMQCVYAIACAGNDMTYKEYCDLMDQIKKGYKKLWDKNGK